VSSATRLEAAADELAERRGPAAHHRARQAAAAAGASSAHGDYATAQVELRSAHASTEASRAAEAKLRSAAFILRVAPILDAVVALAGEAAGELDRIGADAQALAAQANATHGVDLLQQISQWHATTFPAALEAAAKVAASQ